MEAIQLDAQELQANLAFLDRCQLTGKEAETMVRLRYKLIEMMKQVGQPPAETPPKKAGSTNGPKPKARKKR